jgi:hypothetical protein
MTVGFNFSLSPVSPIMNVPNSGSLAILTDNIFLLKINADFDVENKKHVF